MAVELRFHNKCALIVLALSLSSVIVIASSRELPQQDSPREKRTITVIARGLANIFGLDLENGQSSSGQAKSTTSNPLIITYPPIQRVSTQAYQQLTYPTLPTTTPSPAPITHHPTVTLPPPTAKPLPETTKPPPPPPLKQKGQLTSSPNPTIALPTSPPTLLAPKRLITLRPPPLSPTRIITSKPLSITTYLQTERTESQSGRLDGKKEVVLIGIPVTIHKFGGGLNLGLFNGGNDAGQLQEFQNAYNKKKAKDIESVEHTNKVKENSYKTVKNFETPHKDVKNVGLVDDYDEYRKRISNKIKTQGVSEESKSNNIDFTTSSSPYKYDEFDIPDVASQDVGNHQENDDYSDKENERETWKFYREESKNARPPVQGYQDSETRDKRPRKEENNNAKHEGGMEYERYKDLTIMKVNERNKEPEKKYQDPDEHQNSSYEEHRDVEHQRYNDDSREHEDETRQRDTGDNHHHEDGRHNPRDRDNYQTLRESHRQNMEDNIGKHRHEDEREPNYEGHGEDSRSHHSEKKRHRNEGRGQNLNEGSGSRDTEEGHGEFDYGHYRDDDDHKESDEHRANNEKKPQRDQENEEKHTREDDGGYYRGRNNYNREQKYAPGSKHREISTKNRQPHRNQENSEETHGGREENHQHDSRERQKTPKDEKKNENAGRQHDNRDEHGGGHISWDFGPSGSGRNTKERGQGDEAAHHVGWKHQAENTGSHPQENHGPFNYEQNSWAVQHNPGTTSLKNNSAPHPEHPEQGTPEQGIGHHHAGGEVFDYDQYTKNHGVSGFQFPSPYGNIHSTRENFWSPSQGVDHEKYVHHGAAPAYQPQLYSYDAPGYFGAFRPPGFEQQEHSFGDPVRHFNPHAVVPLTVPTKGPQRRTEVLNSGKRKTEIDELASDRLSREMQRDVPATGSRPKKSGSGGIVPKTSEQLRKEVKTSQSVKKITSSSNRAKPSGVGYSYPAPSRPRAVLQAIQQIEDDRRPQLWPTTYDASFDSSRRVTVSTPSNPRPIPKSSSESRNLNSRGNSQVKSKFEPFKTKPNEKVELKFGWPKSLLKEDSLVQGLKAQRGSGQKLAPTSYTKNPKTSYQADAELYDFGKFNKNTGHYETHGSGQIFRRR